MPVPKANHAYIGIAYSKSALYKESAVYGLQYPHLTKKEPCFDHSVQVSLQGFLSFALLLLVFISSKSFFFSLHLLVPRPLFLLYNTGPLPLVMYLKKEKWREDKRSSFVNE